MAPLEAAPVSYLKRSGAGDSLTAVVRQARENVTFRSNGQDEQGSPPSTQSFLETWSPQRFEGGACRSAMEAVPPQTWSTQPVSSYVPGNSGYSAKPGSHMRANASRPAGASQSGGPSDVVGRAPCAQQLAAGQPSTVATCITVAPCSGQQVVQTNMQLGQQVASSPLASTGSVSGAQLQVTYSTVKLQQRFTSSPSTCTGQDTFAAIDTQPSTYVKQQVQHRAYTPPPFQSARPHSPLTPTSPSVRTPASLELSSKSPKIDRAGACDVPRTLVFGNSQINALQGSPESKPEVTPEAQEIRAAENEEQKPPRSSSSFVLERGPDAI